VHYGVMVAGISIYTELIICIVNLIRSFKSIPLHTSNRSDLRSAPLLRRDSKVRVGLPSVNTDGHSPRGMSHDSGEHSLLPSSPLFSTRRQFTPPDPHRPRGILHLANHAGISFFNYPIMIYIICIIIKCL
jgi:hypothetical protein